MEGNVDEGDDEVLENKYKDNVRYEDYGKSTGVRDIGGEGWLGGAVKEIRHGVWQKVQDAGEGYVSSV